MDALTRYLEDHREQFLERLKAVLRIPSVSAQPSHRDDVKRCAQHVAELMKSIGLTRAEVVATPKHPLVYGEWLGAPGKPTVLIYGHYDVQPVDPIELWRTPPFEPTIEGDSLRARGAVDDKGPTLAALKALDALRAVQGQLPVNVKVLLEGEEEAGGESIDAYVRANPERLKAD